LAAFQGSEAELRVWVSDGSALHLEDPDALGHQVFQVEFPLLQRFFLYLFFIADLTLRGQFREAVFAVVMLFNPLLELRIFRGENPLNVSGAIRHRSLPPLKSYRNADFSTPESGRRKICGLD
jgi:hypothetical protein